MKARFPFWRGGLGGMQMHRQAKRLATGPRSHIEKDAAAAADIEHAPELLRAGEGDCSRKFLPMRRKVFGMFELLIKGLIPGKFRIGKEEAAGTEFKSLNHC